MNRDIIVAVIIATGVGKPDERLADAFEDVGQTIEDMYVKLERFADMEYLNVEDVVIEPRCGVPPYHPKLLRYDKRRNFVRRSDWHRIRSNPKLR